MDFDAEPGPLAEWDSDRQLSAVWHYECQYERFVGRGMDRDEVRVAAAEVLLAVEDRLVDGAFCQEARARRMDNSACLYDDPYAAQWCATGAIALETSIKAAQGMDRKGVLLVAVGAFMLNIPNLTDFIQATPNHAEEQKALAVSASAANVIEEWHDMPYVAASDVRAVARSSALRLLEAAGMEHCCICGEHEAKLDGVVGALTCDPCAEAEGA